MFVNFALDILGTSVSCDKVSTDDHECSNLIHTNYTTRGKGYLAEHFVRPPVHVTFSFPCSINVSHVVLEPFVGQQQSMQIELLCAHKAPPRTSHGKAQHKANILNSANSSNESNLPAFHVVSKITNSSRSPMCFFNPRFNSRSSSSGKNYSDYQIKSEMRHSRSELLTCASHIMVKITRTLRSSTPAINGVEIWGCVSSSVCDEVRQVVEKKYHRFVTPEIPLNNALITLTGDKSDTCGKGSESNKTEVGDTFEIPEEFLDPLTWEVMTIPMLLPSGKNIDKTSLDRFSDSEASHGRQPRDPFTGVEFSASIKPIPNLDLKARIDAFLMSNSNNKSVSLIPRTLGIGKTNSLLGKRRRIDNGGTANVSSLVMQGSLTKSAAEESVKYLVSGKERNEVKTEKTIQGNMISTFNDNGINWSNSSSSSSSSGDRNRNDVSVSSGDSKNNRNHNKTSTNEYESPSKRASTVKGCYSGGVSSVDQVSAESHDARLKASLDSALFSVLGKKTSSSHLKLDRNSDECLTRDHNACVWCGQGNQHPGFLMYATPCHHLICRHCLLSMSTHDCDISCEKCGKSFKKKDVVRAH